MADKCKLLFVNENMLFCSARWKLHYTAFKFGNFLGEQAPRPPSPLKKRLVLIQSVTLIKSTGYFNNIVIEIPGEMIILFFPKIWLIFKVWFEVERSLFIPLQICNKDESCQIQAVYVWNFTLSFQKLPVLSCLFFHMPVLRMYFSCNFHAIWWLNIQ